MQQVLMLSSEMEPDDFRVICPGPQLHTPQQWLTQCTRWWEYERQLNVHLAAAGQQVMRCV
jgi:hypothetical protein